MVADVQQEPGSIGQLRLGTEHRVRLGRDLARLQLTYERMFPQLQRDVQECIEHGSTRAAMDHEQIHVARRLRLSAGNRAIEGYRRQALPESVAHPAQVQVQKWLQFGVPMTPTRLAGRQHGASEYHEPAGDGDPASMMARGG